jgi:hypothetical protein
LSLFVCLPSRRFHRRVPVQQFVTRFIQCRRHLSVDGTSPASSIPQSTPGYFPCMQSVLLCCHRSLPSPVPPHSCWWMSVGSEYGPGPTRLRVCVNVLCTYSMQALRALQDRGLSVVHVSVQGMSVPDIARVHQLAGGDHTGM